MGVVRAATTLVAGIAWRVSGADAAGQLLVRRFEGEDESARAIAGMAIVQAGSRSVPLLVEHAAGEDAADFIELLGDIGNEEAVAALTDIAATDLPAAGPATQALERISRYRSDEPS